MRISGVRFGSRRIVSTVARGATGAVVGVSLAAFVLGSAPTYAATPVAAAAAAPAVPAAEPTDEPAVEPADEPTGEPSAPTSEPTGEPSAPTSPSSPTTPPPSPSTPPSAPPTTPDADPGAEPTADTIATSIAVAGPASYRGEFVDVRIAVTDANGQPVAGVPLTAQRYGYKTWMPLPDLVTGSDGTAYATIQMSKWRIDNRVRVQFAGNATYAASTGEGAVTMKMREAVVYLEVKGSSVRDEHPYRLWMAVTDEVGNVVTGKLEVQVDDGSGTKILTRVSLDAQGKARLDVYPRKGSKYRAIFRTEEWIYQGTSPSRYVSVLPYTNPVALPAGAPKPSVDTRALTPARATVAGAFPQVLTIPNNIWNHMVGRSWRSGCPVGRADLRLVRVNYIGFDGFRYRGEMVVHRSVATRTANALAAMHNSGIPIRLMIRVDWFGYSSTVRGADDYRSMAADNTSAFNCRDVVGKPGTRSPHSYGRSIDINPWENPYHSARGVVPNTWWVSRSHPQVAWRSSGHTVVKLLARYGIRWTYGLSDKHHFDA